MLELNRVGKVHKGKLILLPIHIIILYERIKRFLMKKMVSILRIILITFLSFILVINVCIIIQSKLNPNKVPSIFGYKPFIVLSGSMESEINIGDLVFVKKVSVKELEVNDIIAFRNGENLVTTHRIVKEININNQKCFKTKGDLNNAEDDETVCEKQIEGKYQGKIAKVGNVIMFIQEPAGFTIIMLLILIICILFYIMPNNEINKISDEELKEFEEFKKVKAKKQKKTEKI